MGLEAVSGVPDWRNDHPVGHVFQPQRELDGKIRDPDQSGNELDHKIKELDGKMEEPDQSAHDLDGV